MSELLAFMNLFEEFRAGSWTGWRAILAELTGDVREFFAIAGRGSGKSRIVALIASFFATREYPRAPGESIYVGVFAPDRRQAGITFRYTLGLLKSVPVLAALIVNEAKESVELSNGVVIEVVTASTGAPRGRAYACAIVEEAAFLPTDESANPDVELLRALRPALARVPGSLLCVVSSPYAQRGILWDAWLKYHDRPVDDVLVVKAPTLALNPVFDAGAIERAYEDDPVSAAAEYGAEFRSDVEGFVSKEVVLAAVVPGRRELPRLANVVYVGFLDFAGGGSSGGDSAVVAIAHGEMHDSRHIVVLDVIREARPPFSPEGVCEDFSRLLRDYGVTTAVADRWAGQFPVEQMAKHGITVTPSARSKREIYHDMLPILNSGGCELLDEPRLITQLSALERRVARGGRDSIDHRPGAHDDSANAAAGALLLATAAREAISLVDEPEDAYEQFQRGRFMARRVITSPLLEDQ